jgi:hypothetical protein
MILAEEVRKFWSDVWANRSATLGCANTDHCATKSRPQQFCRV